MGRIRRWRGDRVKREREREMDGLLGGREGKRRRLSSSAPWRVADVDAWNKNKYIVNKYYCTDKCICFPCFLPFLIQVICWLDHRGEAWIRCCSLAASCSSLSGHSRWYQLLSHAVHVVSGDRLHGRHESKRNLIIFWCEDHHWPQCWQVLEMVYLPQVLRTSPTGKKEKNLSIL